MSESPTKGPLSVFDGTEEHYENGYGRRKAVGSTSDGGDHGEFLISAAETYAATGRHAANLTASEKRMIEFTMGKVRSAKGLGANRDAGAFYDEVKSSGALDVKYTKDGRWRTIDQPARERYGNWLFGVAGASWEHGALGDVGARASDIGGQGETILRKGAGLYQMFGAPHSGLKWQAGQLTAPGLPINTYGDNPEDQPLISRGYDFYYKSLYPQSAGRR